MNKELQNKLKTKNAVKKSSISEPIDYEYCYIEKISEPEDLYDIVNSKDFYDCYMSGSGLMPSPENVLDNLNVTLSFSIEFNRKQIGAILFLEKKENFLMPCDHLELIVYIERDYRLKGIMSYIARHLKCYRPYVLMVEKNFWKLNPIITTVKENSISEKLLKESVITKFIYQGMSFDGFKYNVYAIEFKE